MIIAYDSLLLCDSYWEKIFLLGALGITNNSVLGSMCGILYGLEFGMDESVNKTIFKDEEWVKKAIVLAKKCNLS